MRIAVTGGAGFIGANLCRELLDRGHDVAALDDLSTGDEANLAGCDAVRLHHGSILDDGALDAALAGRPLPVHGDGEQSRDFTYVGTVTRVLADAVLGTTLQRQHLPTRAGDVRHSQADQTRFRQLFPDVEPLPLREGLTRTVEWFSSRR